MLQLSAFVFETLASYKIKFLSRQIHLTQKAIWFKVYPRKRLLKGNLMKNINMVQLGEKDVELLNKIKQAVHKILHEGTLIFFGSRVRGEESTDSDWDILVLSETVTSELKHNIRTTIFDIELEEGIIINLLILPKDEWDNGCFRNHPLRRNVEAEGILI